MNVALFIPTVGAGGAERVITRMANYWAERDHVVSLVSLDDPSRIPFFPLHPDVTYEALHLLKDEKDYRSKIRRTARQIRVVRQYIKKRKPDVLIAQLDIAIFLAIAATRGLPTRVVIYEGTNPYLSQTNRYLKKFNPILYRLADHLVLQTYQIAATFPLHLQKKISVIYNPIATPSGVLKAEDYTNALAQERIVSIGRLAYPKAYEVLIEAFFLFSKNYPNWSLLIMGEGEERRQLEALCQKLGITNQVFMPGSVSNPTEVLHSCSIFVLSSRYEGLPNTLCEAMSVGMPVVATRCQFGPEEIVQHGENGLLVPVEDPESLASALATLAEDVELCARLGTNARAITDKLHIDKIMQQWEAVIHSL